MGGRGRRKGVRKNGLGFLDRKAGKRPSETNKTLSMINVQTRFHRFSRKESVWWQCFSLLSYYCYYSAFVDVRFTTLFFIILLRERGPSFVVVDFGQRDAHFVLLASTGDGPRALVRTDFVV